MERIRLWKDEWLQLLILAEPFILIAVFWPHVPDRVPMQWGANGHVNWSIAKGSGIFIVPLINIGMAALLIWLAQVDPKAHKMRLPNESVKPIRIVVTAFISAFVSLSLFPQAWELNASVIDLSAGVLILLLGNFLPKVKPNYFVGIRTPWALEDPENWRRTHQYSGRLWVIAALTYLILSFLLPRSAQEVALLGFIAIIAIPPYIYSYVLFQKSKHA